MFTFITVCKKQQHQQNEKAITTAAAAITETTRKVIITSGFLMCLHFEILFLFRKYVSPAQPFDALFYFGASCSIHECILYTHHENHRQFFHSNLFTVVFSNWTEKECWRIICVSLHNNSQYGCDQTMLFYHCNLSNTTESCYLNRNFSLTDWTKTTKKKKIILNPSLFRWNGWQSNTDFKTQIAFYSSLQICNLSFHNTNIQNKHKSL